MSSQFKWFRSYRLLLEWQLLRFKTVLPFIVIIQLFTGVGTMIGLGFLFPKIDPDSALYLATGAPTLTLISLGLTMMPQMVAQAKAQGAFDYMWSLPIPRMAFLAADLTIWLLATVPGVILALAVGAARFGFELQISPLVVPAFLLVAITATSIGYALAHLTPKPDLVSVITNFLIFSLFLFSPINFPVERLPTWLAALHRFLPIKYAADAVRGTLAAGYADDLRLAFTVLGVWFVTSFGATYVVVTRRR
jgi:ABC-2 type transport system permease protein